MTEYELFAITAQEAMALEKAKQLTNAEIAQRLRQAFHWVSTARQGMSRVTADCITWNRANKKFERNVGIIQVLLDELETR